MRAHCLSRRAMLAGSGALAAAVLLPGAAIARIDPKQMVPLIGPGYRPTDADEQGLWDEVKRVEEEVSGSSLVINQGGVNDYLRELIGKVGGPAARDFRIYLLHVPEFNAMMFPTGFAVVFSGLLLRMRNEAQLAGVIAHECGHFLRKHMIREWRDTRRKNDIFAVGAMALGGVGAGAGLYMGDIAQLAELGTILSLFRYSRELEAEADATGLRLIAEAGYSPMEMSRVWEQMIGEMNASAYYRHTRRDRGYSIFADHPAPDDRMADLKASAQEMTVPGRIYDTGRERYLKAIAPIRQRLLDDQVKLNDPGASEYIIQTLAQDGWNGLLRFYEGEVWRLRDLPGDEGRAEVSYAAAVTYPDAPAEAWRWHGLALIKAGRRPDGRAALSHYLALKPDAPDAPWIRQLIG